MELLPGFRWLAHTPLNAVMNQSVWAFAVIEMVHLLALAVLGGAVLVVSLRMLGVWLRAVDQPTLLRALGPVVLTALLVALLSGGLLLSSAPLKYFFNVAFRAKMLFLLLGLVGYAAMHGLSLQNRPVPRGVLPALALVTLGLWLAVGVGGRLIGLI